MTISCLILAALMAVAGNETELTLSDACVSAVFSGRNGALQSLKGEDGRERVLPAAEAFALSLLSDKGEETILKSSDFAFSRKGSRLVYQRPQGPKVEIDVRVADGELLIRPRVSAWPKGQRLNWIDAPRVDVAEKGSLYWPMLDGCEVTNYRTRLNKRSWAWYEPVGWPKRMKGSCGYYPGTAQMQFLAHYCDGAGLYFAAHDAAHTQKGVEWEWMEDGRVRLSLQTFCGEAKEGCYESAFEYRLRPYAGGWREACSIYRDWVRTLPAFTHPAPRQKWMRESPVVLIYPVKGQGRDNEIGMEPNRYYPYVNAMTEVEKYGSLFNSKIMALLMHWEGTAPWCPPYVWPPYGGEAALARFRDALHARGDLLGLYCSGTAWTQVSCVDPLYSRSAQFVEEGLARWMMRGPKGEIDAAVCNHPLAQRFGYDMCLTEDWSRRTLIGEAEKMAKFGVDYCQFFDQNLGGGPHFCWSAAHRHPSVPGAWESKAMVDLQEDMITAAHRLGSDMAFGCEGAAATPFVRTLPFNDARSFFARKYGRAVPGLPFVFHEWMCNFSGNQCGSRSDPFFRMAYSFHCGDMMSVVLGADGKLVTSWTTPWEDPVPDQDDMVKMVSTLNDLRRRYPDHLFDGRAIEPFATVQTATASDGDPSYPRDYPVILSSFWEDRGGVRLGFLTNWRKTPSKASVTYADGTKEELTLAPFESRVLSDDERRARRTRPTVDARCVRDDSPTVSSVGADPRAARVSARCGESLRVEVRQTATGPRLFVNGVVRKPRFYYGSPTCLCNISGTRKTVIKVPFEAEADTTRGCVAFTGYEGIDPMWYSEAKLVDLTAGTTNVVLGADAGEVRTLDYIADNLTFIKGHRYHFIVTHRATRYRTYFHIAVSYVAADGRTVKLPYYYGDTLGDTVRLAATAGVDFVTFSTDSSWGCEGWWTPPGEPDGYARIDSEFERLISINPNVLLVPRLMTDAPGWMLKRHPEMKMVFDTGFNLAMSSVSSRLYRQSACAAIERVARHLRTKFPRNFAGLQISGQNSAEWFYMLSTTENLSGYDSGTHDAFRLWLKERGDPDWATAEVPTSAARHQAKKDARLLSFTEFRQREVASLLVDLGAAAKRGSDGAALVCFFYGYSWELNADAGAGETGHFAFDWLMQHAHGKIDAFSSPVSYSCRNLTGSALMMSAAETVLRRGYLWFNEIDHRTHHEEMWDHMSIFTPYTDPKITREIFFRDSAADILRGYGDWWMDLFGRGWFRDREIWQLRRDLDAIETAMMSRKKPYSPGIASVVHEPSFWHDGWLCSRKGVRNRRGFATCGADYGQYLLSDILENPPASVKLFYFPVADHLSAEERAKLDALKAARPDATFVENVTPQDVTAEAIAARARKAGVHLYTAPGKANVCSAEGYVAIQALEEGPLEIDMGRAGVVVDALTGKTVGEGPKLVIEFRKGENRIFH